jgi:hypothetical protein
VFQQTDNDTSNLPVVLKQDDLAQLLDVSVRSIERYRREAKLPAPLIPGARPRWGRDQIVTWLRGRGR